MERQRRFFTLVVAFSVMMALVPFAMAQEVQKININTASAEELMQLDGIGQEYAKRIVEYREDQGAFKAAEDLTNVSGIGPKTWELNKDRITVE
jgi:competence protein ComEA